MSFDSHVSYKVELDPVRTGTQLSQLVCELALQNGENFMKVWTEDGSGFAIGQTSIDADKSLQVVPSKDNKIFAPDQEYSEVFVVRPLPDGKISGPSVPDVVRISIAPAAWVRDFKQLLARRTP